MSRDNYLFGTGYIRAAENKLLRANEMERMIDAQNIEESFKVFKELSYSDELLDIKDPENYREVLAKDLGQTVNLLVSMSPDNNLTELMLAPYDFHNLKILFKAKYAGGCGNEEAVLSQENLFSFGYVNAEQLAEAVLKGGSTLFLSGDYAELVKSATIKAEEFESPFEIDNYFDKEYFRFVLKRAVILDKKDLLWFIRSMIDISNIKVAVRSRLLERSSEEALNSMADGGKIDKGRIVSGYEKDSKDFFENALSFLDGKEFGKELWQFEKAMDDHVIRKLKEARMRPHGPLVFMAYLLAKENSIKNISIIMAGKINSVAGEEIKSRVRELY